MLSLVQDKKGRARADSIPCQVANAEQALLLLIVNLARDGNNCRGGNRPGSGGGSTRSSGLHSSEGHGLDKSSDEEMLHLVDAKDRVGGFGFLRFERRGNQKECSEDEPGFHFLCFTDFTKSAISSRSFGTTGIAGSV